MRVTKVKVLSSDGVKWYSDKIGQEFYVTDNRTLLPYSVFRLVSLQDGKLIDDIKYIWPDDCSVLYECEIDVEIKITEKRIDKYYNWIIKDLSDGEVIITQCKYTEKEVHKSFNYNFEIIRNIPETEEVDYNK